MGTRGWRYNGCMTRPRGRRNDDYQETRDSLVARAGAAWLSSGDGTLSFRQFADAAGIAPTTLRHYFPDKTGLFLAVMASWRETGGPFLDEAATRAIPDVFESLKWFLGFILEGWRAGLGLMHTRGLTLGLGHPELGPAYLKALLEPTLTVAEARLARHIAENQLDACDVRTAALDLVSPVLTVLLHQESLGGAGCRPLQVESFVSEHLNRFLRAYAPPQ